MRETMQHLDNSCSQNGHIEDARSPVHPNHPKQPNFISFQFFCHISQVSTHSFPKKSPSSAHQSIIHTFFQFIFPHFLATSSLSFWFHQPPPWLRPGARSRRRSAAPAPGSPPATRRVGDAMHRSPGSSGAEPGWIRGGHIGKGGIHLKISASITPNIIWGWVKTLYPW